MKALIRFFDTGFLLKAFNLLLLYSLIPLGEIYLLYIIAGRVGIYVTLAVAATTGLLGLFLAYSRAAKAAHTARAKVRDGYYPTAEFIELAGNLLGAVLVIIPGFATDAAGLLLLLPVFRNMAGRIITGRMQDRLKELYEYLKLYDV
jgi:UPF0716 protein FxsA